MRRAAPRDPQTLGFGWHRDPMPQPQPRWWWLFGGGGQEIFRVSCVCPVFSFQVCSCTERERKALDYKTRFRDSSSWAPSPLLSLPEQKNEYRRDSESCFCPVQKLLPFVEFKFELMKEFNGRDCSVITSDMPIVSGQNHQSTIHFHFISNKQ